MHYGDFRVHVRKSYNLGTARLIFLPPAAVCNGIRAPVNKPVHEKAEQEPEEHDSDNDQNNPNCRIHDIFLLPVNGSESIRP